MSVERKIYINHLLQEFDNFLVARTVLDSWELEDLNIFLDEIDRNLKNPKGIKHDIFLGLGLAQIAFERAGTPEYLRTEAYQEKNKISENDLESLLKKRNTILQELQNI